MNNMESQQDTEQPKGKDSINMLYPIVLFIMLDYMSVGQCV